MPAAQYGVHFTCFVTNIEKRTSLNSKKFVARFLRDLVDATGMRILAGPLTAREEGDASHAGVSGVVILFESHAAIHTYPKIGAVFIDVFSCKTFSEEHLYPVFDRCFGRHEISERAVTDRGEHWIQEVEDALSKWNSDRGQHRRLTSAT